MNIKALQQLVFLFLKAHVRPKSPLLLAYSGGGDSKALLYLAAPICQKMGIPLAIAHITHGSREEEEERRGKSLEEEVHNLGLPFYWHKEPFSGRNQGNLEEKWRKIRLQALATFYEEWHADGLLLAHHADDNAETILKRICEGSALTHLGGMQVETKMASMRLLRPMLTIRKSQLLHFLISIGLSPLNDNDNQNDRFLRGRCRRTIFPFLEKNFGKNGLIEHFCRLGKDANDLLAYFTQKTASIREQRLDSPHGFFWPSLGQIPAIELYYALKISCDDHVIGASKILIDQIVQKIGNTGSQKRFVAQKGIFYLEETTLLWMKKPLPCFEGTYDCTTQKNQCAAWNITRDTNPSEIQPWQSAILQRSIYIELPPETKGWFLISCKEAPFVQKILEPLWKEANLPRFLRKRFPILINFEKKYYLDSLTGISNFKICKKKEPIKLRISF